MKSDKPTLPKWMWWSVGKCVVEVTRSGYYPDTAMVKLPDDNIVCVYLNDLSVPKNDKA